MVSKYCLFGGSVECGGERERGEREMSRQGGDAGASLGTGVIESVALGRVCGKAKQSKVQ